MINKIPEKIEFLDVRKIEKHPEVPNIRSKINKSDIKELKDSIREKGIKNPITVFKDNGIVYFVSGERRIKSILELSKEEPDKFDYTIPAIVMEYSDNIRQALFDNFIENIQREDVNPVDVANRISLLMEKGYQKTVISKEIGKSIVWINETLNFIQKADETVKEKVQKGEMTFDEGKKVSKLSTKEKQKIVAEGIAEAKEKGDKKSLKIIKKALEEKVRTRSTVAPGKKEIIKKKEIIALILKEMKKKKINETEVKKFSGFEGILLGLKYALGEEQDIKIGKVCKDLGIDPETGEKIDNEESD
jgi:ParB/RepB/Spo0J family partition protein